MAVNIRGPFLMVKHVAPHMTAQGYGKIINIGSGTVARGIPDSPLRHHEGRRDGDHPGAQRASSASTASASTRWRPVSR